MLQIKLRYSWLAGSENTQALDQSLFNLLYAIHRTGSINKAARHVGLSYRYVWGMVGKWQTIFGRSLVEMRRGRGARLTSFGEKLLWAEQRVRARLSPQLESLAAEVERELNQVFEVVRPSLRIHASHDLALAQLRDLLAPQTGTRLDLQFRGSLDAMASLARGDCDIAGFHIAENRGQATPLPLSYRQYLKPRAHRLIYFVTRQQGLILPAGNPRRIRGLRDVASSKARFVNRQQGSGTRLQFDQLLWEAGIEAIEIDGYAQEEFTHLAVAATVASGMADAGFGIKAAAVQYGLDFVPMSNEDYFLLCKTEMLKKQTVQGFVKVLQGPEFKTIVANLSGYDAARAGQAVSIREAMPWYDKTPGDEKSGHHNQPKEHRHEIERTKRIARKSH
ncbi:MAG TPA: substrate-binding domain-containing protein [Burkholderiales bacterium]|nr:substrate-binding domain-containing protein [Burkholderiales bacterium]